MHHQHAFPAAWPWLADEAIPAWVKSRYSPRESWKGKPFGPPDAAFFSRGIRELSELFTDERPGRLPDYFLQPRFRSSYLLYFLPLQAAKFLTLFHLHSEAIDAALRHGRKTGVLRLLDLGSGPGTASIALLLELLDRKTREAPVPEIELHWFDTNAKILKDGEALVELIASHFPGLRGKVRVHAQAEPWWKAAGLVRAPVSLTLVGHVLNETSGDIETTARRLEEVLALAEGGGALIVEPAARRPSQQLSKVRDELLEHEPRTFWGPCLHAERCPLASGRDWCHFSLPVEIPGRWFRTFSKAIGSERHWLKFSYLWLASAAYKPKPLRAGLRRVISDPLRGPGGASVLLCEPERPGRMKVGPDSRVRRGDLVDPKTRNRPAPFRGPAASEEG
jgi:hypothetical protein